MGLKREKACGKFFNSPFSPGTRERYGTTIQSHTAARKVPPEHFQVGEPQMLSRNAVPRADKKHRRNIQPPKYGCHDLSVVAQAVIKRQPHCRSPQTATGRGVCFRLNECAVALEYA